MVRLSWVRAGTGADLDLLVLPTGSGEGAADLRIAVVGLSGDSPDRNLEGGLAGEWKGMKLEEVADHPGMDVMVLEMDLLAGADCQGKSVGEPQEDIVLANVGTVYAGLLEPELAAWFQSLEELSPAFGQRSMDGLRMLGDEQRDQGPPVGESKDPSFPELEPFGLRVMEKVVGASGLGVDPGCRICLSPTIVVLPSSIEEPLAARVFGQTVGSPERQQITGEPSVVRLGDEGERICVIDNDHDVNKNSELEDLRICLFIFPNPGESKWWSPSGSLIAMNGRSVSRRRDSTCSTFPATRSLSIYSRTPVHPPCPTTNGPA
jgi:hypothetical protein